MKKIFYTSLLLLFTFTCFSQNYKIDVKIKGMTDSVAYLLSYTGNAPYYYDTAFVKKDGSFTFIKDTMPHGVYAIIYDSKRPSFFDILVNETRINLEAEIADVVGSMKVKKSEENKLFFDYLKFFNYFCNSKKCMLLISSFFSGFNF